MINYTIIIKYLLLVSYYYYYYESYYYYYLYYYYYYYYYYYCCCCHGDVLVGVAPDAPSLHRALRAARLEEPQGALL